MGLFKMSTGEQPKLGEPQPHRFTLLAADEVNGWTVVLARYPDATEFDGAKVMVFKGSRAEEILKAKILDPHFLSKADLTPFARFAPTEEGLQVAFAFCEAVTSESC